MANKHCLLVVDDEPDLVQSVKDLLRFDYRVLGTTRATEGLKIMDQEEVHVVMTDQRMPEMTGIEFLKSLKKAHPEAIRLLFTAYADIDVVTDAINEGSVYRYVSKPWDTQELRSVLKQAVERYELQAERKRLHRELEESNRQLAKKNQELEHANELKRAFIRVASHELRTPLTVVLGLSELGATAPEGASLKNWLGQINKHAARLNGRVDQMVKLLQADRFERSLKIGDVDVARLIARSAEAVSSFIEQRKLTLHLLVSDKLGCIRGEEEKLQDSLVQLLINAIRFTPDGGRIRVTAERTPAGALTIAVQDTGIGIDPHCMPHIFEPFFTKFDVSHHCSGTFQFDKRGLGLGLTVAKTFVEMHGGKLLVQSEVGLGSTFTIELPASPVCP